MRELLIRSVSGVLYAALILVSACWSQLAFISVLFVFSTLALVEFQKLIRHKSPVSFLLFGLLTYQFYTQTLAPSLYQGFLLLTLLTSGYLTYCLLKNKDYPSAPFQRSGLTFFYLIGSGFFLLATTSLAASEPNTLTLSMFVLIWTNNSFAYLFGKRWGKTLLFPSISPKKTWEGFWGGALSCFVVSMVFLFLNTGIEKWVFPLLALLIVVTATLGDLIQSKFKREAHVKNSGSLIPGHGGFFDRMDSVLYTAPFVYLVFKISEYVS